MSKPVSVETPEEIVNRWRAMNVKISRYLYQSPAAVAQLCEMFASALKARDERVCKWTWTRDGEHSGFWTAQCKEDEDWPIALLHEGAKFCVFCGSRLIMEGEG